MYQLVSAIAQLKAAGTAWAAVDLSTLALSDIDSAYSDVYLRVSSPFWTKDQTMRFGEITRNYADRTQTLAEFFAAQGNTTLPATDGLAEIVTGQVKYADAVWAGYKLERGKYNASPSTIPDPDDADVLLMSKPGVDARVFYKNCLVSINGLLHRTDADSQYVYVIDGAKSNYLSRRNEVGILNFRDVGELTYVPITEDMLFKAHADQPFANQIFIKSPVSAEGKTAALVMGGYLFLLDNLSFFRTADDIFCLDTQTVALLDRFYESRGLIDLSSLGLEYNGAHQMQISRAQLFSDAVLTRWLTLSQSFLLFIDSPSVVVERTQLAPTQSARQYLTYEEPTRPLAGGFGLLWPYWPQEDDGVWSLTVGDNVYHHRLFHTTPAEMAPMPADNRRPVGRESYSYAHFLNIESEKIVITPNT